MSAMDISAMAAALGRRGGKVGGKSRSAAKVAAARRNVAKATASLTPRQRSERARKAALTRWKNKNGAD